MRSVACALLACVSLMDGCPWFHKGSQPVGEGSGGSRKSVGGGISDSYDSYGADFDPGVVVPPLLAAYDSLQGKVLPGEGCVQETGNANPNLGNPKQLVEYDLNHVTASQNLSNSLNLNAAASLGFGTGRVKATYSYFSSAKSSDYDESLTVHVFVQNQVQSSPTVRFRHGKDTELGRNPLRFYQECGDRYVSVQITGGEYLAVARFTSQTTEEQKTVAATLEASAGKFDTNESFTQEAKKVTGLTNYSAKILMKGPTTEIESEIPKIIETAKKFPTTVAGANGYVVRIVTAPYPSAESELPVVQRVAMENLARAIGKVYRRRAGLEYMLQHRDQFPTITKKDLDDEEASTETVASGIRTLAEACIQDTTNDKKKCQIDIPRIPDLPSRGQDWTKLADADVKQPSKLLFQTLPDQSMYIEMDGQWTLGAGSGWINVNQSMSLTLQARDNPAKHEQFIPVPGARYAVPPNTSVTLNISDWAGGYQDNEVNSNNPVRYRYYDANPLGRLSAPTVKRIDEAPTVR